MGKSLAKLLDDTYFLSGTRRDTFDLIANTFNEVDSAQYLYNQDDSTLYALVRLINDVDTGWINNLADYYSYDAQKNDTLDLLDFWDYINGVWSNQQRTVNTFDGNHNLTSHTVYIWDAGNFWKGSSREDYSYDTNFNLMQHVIFSTLDGVNWDSTNKFVYTYDSNNNRITETDYFFNGVSFDPTNLFTASYNAANYETQSIGQYWNVNQWKNSFKDTFSYDANNNLVVFERRDWHSGGYTWTNSKSEFTYNGLNQLTGRTDYNGDQVTYLLAYNYTYQYDANENLSHQIQQRYNDALATFQNAEQTFYYYTTIISGVTAPGGDNAYRCKLYPNPAAESIMITMDVAHDANIELQVINSTGQITSNATYALMAGDNSLKVDVSKLPAGIYSARIFNPQTKAQSVNRFVKE